MRDERRLLTQARVISSSESYISLEEKVSQKFLLTFRIDFDPNLTRTQILTVNLISTPNLT